VQLPPIEVIGEKTKWVGGYEMVFHPNAIETQLSDYAASYFIHSGTLTDKGLDKNGVRQYHLQPEPHLWRTSMGTRDLLLFRH
jgi:hypothetical protein